MVIRRNGPFDDMAIDDMVLDEVSCSRFVRGVKKCLFVFVALRPMSTAMVIAGRSVYLTTPFPGQA